MELLLWRHAEAIEASDERPDLKRRLTAHGEKQARRVARWLIEHDPRPLRILVSPAVRCQQTAHPLALPFETDPRLAPAADAADLLEAINWPEGYGKRGGRTLLIGHQPALGRLASLLLLGQERDLAIRKGALWWLSQRKRDKDAPAQMTLKAVIDASLL
jgi:phosphohistidine phosphatase